jgi:ABC-2 type transport system ATP-binding protein
MTAILTLDGLTKTFDGVRAVDDLHAEVLPGEVFGLLGPNGAGKTTTIRMICGELSPDSGRILLGGRPVTASAEDRCRIGLCPQELVIWEKLTCTEQLEFTGQMYGMPRVTARVRAAELLDELGLTGKARALAGTLSGGQRRRLNIALALVHSPELVVLDEPSAGLDPQSRALVRDVIRAQAQVSTVILTTHDMDEADRLSDRVAIIDGGRVLVCDAPAALRAANGGGVIELRFVGGGEEHATAVLAGLAGLTVRSGPGMVSVHTDDPTGALPEVLAALGRGGVAADEVRLRAPSLEDVFLGLTGRSLRS